MMLYKSPSRCYTTSFKDEEKVILQNEQSQEKISIGSNHQTFEYISMDLYTRFSKKTKQKQNLLEAGLQKFLKGLQDI